MGIEETPDGTIVKPQVIRLAEPLPPGHGNTAPLIEALVAMGIPRIVFQGVDDDEPLALERIEKIKPEKEVQ